MGFGWVLCMVGASYMVPFARADGARGSLIGADSKPLANVHVYYGFLGVERRYRLVDATTDPSGAFVLEGVSTSLLPLTGLATLAPGTVATFTLERDGGVAIAKPAHSTLQILVSDSKGNPIAGVPIKISALMLPTDETKRRWLSVTPWKDAIWTAMSTASTDVNGLARFKGLPEGCQVLVDARSKGAVPSGTPAVTIAGDLTQNHLTLTRGAILAGRVLQDGVGVAGVSVSATSQVGRTRQQSGSTITGADGAYRLEGVAPGLIEISANVGKAAEGYAASPLPPLVISEGKERDGLDIRLVKAVRVNIRVVTKEDEHPVPKAIVMVSQGSTTTFIPPTDETGMSTIWVAPGEFEALVDHVANRQNEDGTSVSLAVDDQNHPDLVLHVAKALTLPSITHLEGTVLDASGKPAAGAKVSELRNSSVAVSDDQGRFVIETAIEPGTMLIAQKGDDVTAQAITVMDSSKLTMKLDAKTLSLSGKVVLEDGSPATDTEVSVGSRLLQGYGDGRSAHTDSQGRWTVDGLFPGARDFFIWFKRNGYGDETLQEVRPTGPATTLPEVKLVPKDGAIDGKLVDKAGQPVAGLMISCQGRGDDGLTDEKGEFHLRNVSRGKIVATVGDGHMMWQAFDAQTGQKDLVIVAQPKPAGVAPGVATGDVSGSKVTTLDLGPVVQGTPVTFDSIKGKVAVLDLWATWCGPCRQAMPKVEALYRKFSSKGLVVLGVHQCDGKVPEVAALLKKMAITYPNMLDAKDKTGYGSTFVKFGLKGIPNIVVIDRGGRVVLSSDDVDEVTKTVEELLKAK